MNRWIFVASCLGRERGIVRALCTPQQMQHWCSSIQNALRRTACQQMEWLKQCANNNGNDNRVHAEQDGYRYIRHAGKMVIWFRGTTAKRPSSFSLLSRFFFSIIELDNISVTTKLVIHTLQVCIWSIF